MFTEKWRGEGLNIQIYNGFEKVRTQEMIVEGMRFLETAIFLVVGTTKAEMF